MTKRNGRTNGHSHALAKPSADPIAPRANKVRVAPPTGVPSGPVQWECLGDKHSVVVTDQTWFGARDKGCAALGLGRQQVAVRRLT